MAIPTRLEGGIPVVGQIGLVVTLSQTQRMGRDLFRYRLLAGQCRVGYRAGYHDKCDANCDAKSDSHAYVLHGRPQ
jgi:hypothetical protein